MNRRLAASVLYPLHERLRGRRTLAVLRELERTQWLSGEEVERLQTEKLKRLFSWAYENVPYYRTVFHRMGCGSAQEASEAKLADLPLTAKENVRESLEAMVARGWERRVIRDATSGSTGEPTVFYTDRARSSVDNALQVRGRRWWGVSPGDVAVKIWGSAFELEGRSRLHRVRDALINEFTLAGTDLSGRALEHLWNRIRLLRPVMLYGYATALYQLARYLIELGARDRHPMRVVISTAELLPEGHRGIIEKAFGCRVADEYGARDAGIIAHECPSGGLHISAESMIVEFLSGPLCAQSSDGREIVVTRLDPCGMPLIRYTTGDLGMSGGACSCGRGLPLMADIIGRSRDVILGVGGRAVHGAFWAHLMRHDPALEAVEQYQVVQRAPGEVTVRMVSKKMIPPECIGGLRRIILENLGEGTSVGFEFPARIPPTQSGKFRWIRNETLEEAREPGETDPRG